MAASHAGSNCTLSLSPCRSEGDGVGTTSRLPLPTTPHFPSPTCARPIRHCSHCDGAEICREIWISTEMAARAVYFHTCSPSVPFKKPAPLSLLPSFSVVLGAWALNSVIRAVGAGCASSADDGDCAARIPGTRGSEAGRSAEFAAFPRAASGMNMTVGRPSCAVSRRRQ